MSENPTMPRSIRFFEGLYLCVWVGNFFELIVFQWASVAVVFEFPFVILTVFLICIPVVLALLVSRKRSRVCKWILVVFFILSTVVGSSVGEGGGLGFILSVLFLALFIVLTLLVSRRRSLLVRSILVAVAVVFSVILVPLFLLGGAETGLLTLVFAFMQFVAMVLLFTESSGEWLSSKVSP